MLRVDVLAGLAYVGGPLAGEVVVWSERDRSGVPELTGCVGVMGGCF